MNKKAVQYVNDMFTKVNEQLFISYEDEKILHLATYLNIKEELVSAKKADNDFFTYVIFKEVYDISGVFIFHFGNSKDSGFICFYAPNLVSNKTNILAFLDTIFIQNKSFNREQILNSITISSLRELSTFTRITPRVVKSPNQLYFEINFISNTEN